MSLDDRDPIRYWYVSEAIWHFFTVQTFPKLFLKDARTRTKKCLNLYYK